MLTFNYLYQQLENIQIHTTGCDICIYDARKFANTLPKDEKAIVFNTCSVFKEREVENHLLLKLLSTAFPNHKLYALGCDIDNNNPSYKYENKFINSEVRDKINSQTTLSDDIVCDDEVVYLKIQDGCTHKCTFCIINQLRNNPYSVSYKDIHSTLSLQLKDRNDVKLELAGTELTNYYDKESGYHLTDVIEHIIIDFPQISKILMTSLDPAVSEIEKLIDLINKHRDKLIPHLNLAVQSGNDYILEKMGRRHTVQRIRDIHKYALENNVGIGWDIIVGFPGETDELFNETLLLIKELKPLTKTIFKYSPREKTPAYEMDNQIPESIKEQRLKQVTELVESFKEDYSQEMYCNYLEYVKEPTIEKNLLKINKIDVYTSILNGAKEIYLDIFNLKEFANYIANPKKDAIIHIKYDMLKSLECDIYINFLKEFLRSKCSVIVHVPSEFNEDIERYQKHFHCIICKHK